jgi:hypothetical protein
LRSDARWVYQFLTGKPIPKGYQVHHITNLQDAHLFPEQFPNDPENLALIREEIHEQLHTGDRQLLEGRPRTRINVTLIKEELRAIFETDMKVLNKELQK